VRVIEQQDLQESVLMFLFKRRKSSEEIILKHRIDRISYSTIFNSMKLIRDREEEEEQISVLFIDQIQQPDELEMMNYESKQTRTSMTTNTVFEEEKRKEEENEQR
jgi:hypothetical protein